MHDPQSAAASSHICSKSGVVHEVCGIWLLMKADGSYSLRRSNAVGLVVDEYESLLGAWGAKGA